MSALDLDALEALCNAATPGPWHAGKYGITSRHGVDADHAPRCVVSWDYAWGEQANEPDDKPFIAAARDAVPALITRLRAAEALRDDLRCEVEALQAERDTARVEAGKLRQMLRVGAWKP